MQTPERSWVEIDLSAFRANLKALKRFMGRNQGFIQIVKADAYGHGAAEIAQAALEEGATALGVANLEEGRLLRVQGCKAPVIVLSPSLPGEIPGIIEQKLIPAISDPDFAEQLDAEAGKRGARVKAHLKIDTGMHRSGAWDKDFAALWKDVRDLPNLEIEGVFSHFASGESDGELCRAQEELFFSTLHELKIDVPWTHLANSSALVNGHGLRATHCRLGILSYGIYTHPDQVSRIALKPVMTFKSRLAQIKAVDKGEGVGYNLTWTASRRTRVGIVPVGYADGYDFLLSNRGKVSLAGKVCPVIGRVSMDMICVDLTDVPSPRIGDEVVLLGGSEAVRAENLAAAYEGSSYELLCQVGRRARRYYYSGSRLVNSAPLARRDFVSSDFSDSKLSQIIQSAIARRVDSEELGELISREILRSFFFNKDREIHYRKDFSHHIAFCPSAVPGYWGAKTTLRFSKILQNEYFLVACAASEKALQGYFKRRDVEYRWLLDGNFALSPEAFQLSSVKINGIDLQTEVRFKNACMEIHCAHPDLKELVGKEVGFLIDTDTLYPQDSHQLGVFITELTHGVRISFQPPPTLGRVECVPVFSGQNKFPRVARNKSGISVSTKAGEWVFPLSGVVFAY